MLPAQKARNNYIQTILVSLPVRLLWRLLDSVKTTMNCQYLKGADGIIPHNSDDIGVLDNIL